VIGVTRRGPAQHARADDEPRRTVAEDERAVGQVVDRRLVVALAARVWVDTLAVELGVDCVRARLVGVETAPDLGEARVVRVAAECAGPVPCGECCHLVEEEKLGELAGLEERAALPASELEPTSDPAPAVEAPADVTVVVVEAAAVPVDEPASRVGDELAEGCDAVLQRL
jgi:hypothetical protein